MKIDYFNINPQYFKYIKLNYRKNFDRKLTSRDLSRILNEYIRKLKSQGFTDREIDSMDLKVYYSEIEQ